MVNPGGMNSWSLAFNAMLEGILRDGENMAVTMPFHAIRRHFRKLVHFLEEVKVPRLVVLYRAHDSSVAVEAMSPSQEASLGNKTAPVDLLDITRGDSNGSRTEIG